jgi:DNA-binding NtrC family response regulator
MDPFDERDTISVPVGTGQFNIRREPVIGLRLRKTGHIIELPPFEQRIVVGSGESCDVVLNDRCVSTIHCMLERRSQGLMLVRDQGSKNGTYINGNRVEVAELNPGALLTIGRTVAVALGERTRGTLTAFEQLLGENADFRAAIDTAIRAASSECSALIVGETGTGKELVARAIHDASPRAAGPFVAVNCGAIPHELIGSELFGHDKGAFTGAQSERDGVFVHANGGTLFLDELAELPLQQQPHLLRVLETRRVRRIGAERAQPIDVRVVAATNRMENLGTEQSRLRLDLFHRVATVVVTLPPLRHRSDDIPILANAFLEEFRSEYGERVIPRLTMRAMAEYAWPGNVRELRHAIQRAVVLCPYELTVEALLQNSVTPMSRVARRPHRRAASVSHAHAGRKLAAGSRELRPIDALIRDAMLDALERTGSIRRAAAELGMAKSTFADRARRYGIETSRTA